MYHLFLDAIMIVIIDFKDCFWLINQVSIPIVYRFLNLLYRWKSIELKYASKCFQELDVYDNVR